MENSRNEKISLSKTILPDNPISLDESFPWDECVIKSVCIKQILSNSDIKFAKLFCSFDAYYCDSDDTELTDPKVGPTQVEIVSIPIPSKSEGNKFQPQKTEFIMSNHMNPVFLVTGPCSISIKGYYTIDDNAQNEKDEAENETIDESEEINKETKKQNNDKETNDEKRKKDDNNDATNDATEDVDNE